MTDRVRLTVPRARPYFGVAHLVLGGLAMRQNVTLEALEDLQLAVDEVLEREHGEGAVTLELQLVNGTMETRIGPFTSVVRADLEPLAEGRLGLRRVLDSTVDAVEVETREDGDWVLLEQGAPHLMPNPDDTLLLRRYHEQGDLAARDQLIEQYMSLVRSLARRYAYRGEQLDDLVQIGAIGLIKAIDRFDLDRGVELTTYATPNIIGEIKRHFRDKGWAVRVPRGLQELSVQLSRLIEQLTVQHSRSPTIAEIAKEAGVEEEQVLEALESGRAYNSVSLSAGGGGDEDGDLDPLETIGTEEHEYQVSEDRAVLEPGFKVLDERERRILHLRFFEGLTQSQIAQQIGISQMHVSRLIRRALEKIRRGDRRRRARGCSAPRRAAAEELLRPSDCACATGATTTSSTSPGSVGRTLHALPRARRAAGEPRRRPPRPSGATAATGRSIGYGVWAVEERATGRIVGRLGLSHHRLWPQDVEVGWGLDPEVWGRGYATEGGVAARRARVRGARRRPGRQHRAPGERGVDRGHGTARASSRGARCTGPRAHSTSTCGRSSAAEWAGLQSSP